jgi:beta-glucosidase
MGRIDILLAAMTIEEKIGQLNMVASSGIVTGPGEIGGVEADIRAGRVGSLLNLWGSEEVLAMQRLAVEESRLGIPLLFGLDVVHGHRTIFPVPLAEACLFDPILWEKTARAAAEEAASDGISLTFAPMLDVARDPRWGRVVEGPGEDAWVGAQFAIAKTRGFQGSDLSKAGCVAATAKHLCAYGAVTAGREYASADISERTLREIYLPPFAAAVAAGTAAIMPAFNDVAGVPMTANRAVLRHWLREKAGFDGVVISDYNAVAELLNHGVAADLDEAAALALGAGVDIDMMGGAYSRGLPGALARGLVTQNDIDASVRRVLALKERLGLFEAPYRRGTAISSEHGDTASLAHDVARRAIVLLTHRGGVLPFSRQIENLAVVGPLASAPQDMLGPWASAGRGDEAVSVLKGLRAALPACRVESTPGVDADGANLNGVPIALDLCRAADAIVLCIGETAAMSGEAASRADLGLPGRQSAFAEQVLELGKPVIVVLTSGRPLVMPWLFERADAVLATWFLGTQAGHAIADVLTGAFNPAGKLPLTWPRHGGQVPIFYGQRPSGRPTQEGVRYTSSYRDISASPQFPFGHGLSYSRFTLADLQCEPRRARAGENIQISVAICNDGPLDGEATLFLFTHDPVASVGRPLLELKGAHKIVLAAGASDRATWVLPVEALSFLGPDLEPLLEPGQFDIFVGQSADREHMLSCSFEFIH